MVVKDESLCGCGDPDRAAYRVDVLVERKAERSGAIIARVIPVYRCERHRRKRLLRTLGDEYKAWIITRVRRVRIR